MHAFVFFTLCVSGNFRGVSFVNSMERALGWLFASPSSSRIFIIIYCFGVVIYCVLYLLIEQMYSDKFYFLQFF